MTKKVIDYSKTIIYKIVCNDLEKTEVYVGHTTDFTKRKSRHKNNCIDEKQKSHYNLKIYQYIRVNGGWDNFSMIEIEKYSCNDSNEARARERYWFETLNANLNMVCPTIDTKKRKEKANERTKLYREEHHEEILKKANQKHICECGKIYSVANKARHIKSLFHSNSIQ